MVDSDGVTNSEGSFGWVQDEVDDNEFMDFDPIQILATIDRNLPPEVNYRGYVPTGKFSFGFNEFELRVEVNLQDVMFPIKCRVDNNELPCDTLKTTWASLQQLTVDEIIKAKGVLKIGTSGRILLRLLAEASVHIRKHREASDVSTPEGEGKDMPMSGKEGNTGRKKVGIDLDSVHGIATHILGKTPAEICGDVLEEWAILHCENIIRKDLQTRFLDFQQELREKLMRQDISKLRACVPQKFQYSNGGHAAKEQLVDYLVKPKLTFHGTRRQNVASIVQHGFLKPGQTHPVTKKPLQVYNGSAYGQGIYSSPEAWYSLMYSETEENKPSELPGLKIIVCATIMGRAATLGHSDFSAWGDKTEPYPGADSHVNESQLAYIVFNSAQILPCYVLHLDWAGKTEEHVYGFISQFKTQPSRRKIRASNEEGLMAGDKQRQKEELVAKGKKFFAYGFGSYGGNDIKILDVAEISDDEEDYGEYQGDRLEMKEDNPNFWNWRQAEGEHANDEYAKARKTNINRKM